MPRFALVAVLVFASTAHAGSLPPSYEDACLRSVQFVDANEGWAVGDDGVVWHSTDAGKTWDRQKTGTRASLRQVQFLTPYTGWVAGRIDKPDGSVGVLLKTTDGGLTWTDTVAGELPGLCALKFFDEANGYAVGDGCAAFPSGVFVTKDGGTSWAALPGPRVPGWTACEFADPKTGTLVGRWNTVGRIADGKLSVSSTDVTDPNCTARLGAVAWSAGSPGSIVRVSADGGKSWEARPTGLPVPIRGLCLVSPTVGYAVGEFGTIRATTDGGKTWDVRKCGGQRAAVLCVHANNVGVPVEMMPVVGTQDGYLIAAMTMMSADPKSASPTSSTEGERFLAAVRSAGGAAAFACDQFPLPAHRAELPADKQFDPATREKRIRELVLALRTWRPEVVVTDFDGVAEAVKAAADPSAYPEQLAQMMLKPHAVPRVFTTTVPRKGAASYSVNQFRPEIGDSLHDLTSTAAATLGRPTHELAFWPTTPPHTATLTGGLDLARGGTARRATALAPPSPALLVQREVVVVGRKAISDALAGTEKDADWETTQAKLLDAVKGMPDDDAVDCLISNANRAVKLGHWSVAREAYATTATRFPGRPATADAVRWLMRYHASGEAVRRLELGHHPTLRPTTFFKMPAPPAGDIVQVGYYAPPTLPKVKFRSAEAEAGWVGFGSELEAALFAVAPLSARDPATHLSLNASRLRLGRNADAERDLTLYRRTTAVGAGNPWFDAVAAELWVANRGTSQTPPKPVAVAAPAADKPKLDGKLDDVCWQNATLMNVGESAEIPTTVRFAYDDEYLYIAATCGHPDGRQVPKADSRKRDDDLTGHDRMEFLIDLDRDFGTYYRLRVDHRGCVADDCWGDATWNPTWFVSVEPSPTGWTVEAAIPLAELTGSRPRAGQVWAVNAVRVTPGTGVMGWSLPADVTPRPEGMGLLEFGR